MRMIYCAFLNENNSYFYYLHLLFTNLGNAFINIEKFI